MRSMTDEGGRAEVVALKARTEASKILFRREPVQMSAQQPPCEYSVGGDGDAEFAAGAEKLTFQAPFEQ